MTARTVVYRAVAVGALLVATLGATAGAAQALPRQSGYCGQLLDQHRTYVDMGHAMVVQGDAWYAAGYYDTARQNYQDADVLFSLADAAYART